MINSLFPLVDSLSMDSSVIGVVEYFVALNEMLFNNIPQLTKVKVSPENKVFACPACGQS